MGEDTIPVLTEPEQRQGRAGRRGQGPGGPQEGTDRRGAVDDLFRAMARAWEAGDADAFAAHYTGQASVVLPGAHLPGSAAIRAAMAGAFAGPLHGTRRVHEPLSVRFLGPASAATGSVAVVVTSSVTVAAGADEPPADARERATWVLSALDGRWRVEAYHSCPADAD